MTVAGILLIAVPIAFNVAFARLAATFDYPDVLRKDDVLAKVPGRRQRADPHLVGVRAHRGRDGSAGRAALPRDRRRRRQRPGRGHAGGHPGRRRAVPRARPAAVSRPLPGRDRRRALYQAFNRYLGVAVGEHLGYLFTGAWTALIGVALTQTGAAPALIGAVGIVIGPVLMLCALEFVGRGWPLAGQIVPVAYVVWSLWLVATGIALLVA